MENQNFIIQRTKVNRAYFDLIGYRDLIFSISFGMQHLTMPLFVYRLRINSLKLLLFFFFFLTSFDPQGPIHSHKLIY